MKKLNKLILLLAISFSTTGFANSDIHQACGEISHLPKVRTSCVKFTKAEGISAKKIRGCKKLAEYPRTVAACLEIVSAYDISEEKLKECGELEVNYILTRLRCLTN